MDRLKEISKIFDKLKRDKPKELTGFVNFSQLVMQNTTLDSKHISLILLALSINNQCPLCIAKHIDGAVMAGATKEEILDACMLAVIMGGGPKLMYMNIVVL